MPLWVPSGFIEQYVDKWLVLGQSCVYILYRTGPVQISKIIKQYVLTSRHNRAVSIWVTYTKSKTSNAPQRAKYCCKHCFSKYFSLCAFTEHFRGNTFASVANVFLFARHGNNFTKQWLLVCGSPYNGHSQQTQERNRPMRARPKYTWPAPRAKKARDQDVIGFGFVSDWLCWRGNMFLKQITDEEHSNVKPK